MSPSQPLHALVCDDELSIRNLFSMLLRAAGFQVQVAVDGLDALRKMGEQSESMFDVVITDNNMPRLDGLGLVKALRASNYRGKIVIISGFLDQDKTDQYTCLGVDKILSKMGGMTELGPILLGCCRRELCGEQQVHDSAAEAEAEGSRFARETAAVDSECLIK